MKRITFLLFCMFFSALLSGQSQSADSSKTKLYIIGVVHEANQYRNADMLLEILKEIQPHLILSEDDSSGLIYRKGRIAPKIPWWYKFGEGLRLFRKMPPETDVLFKYKAMEKSVMILPFDRIPKRGRYIREYVRGEKKWIKAVIRAERNDEIPEHLHEKHLCHVAYLRWFIQILDKGYQALNQAPVIDSTREMIQLREEHLEQLTSLVPRLQPFKKWYEDKRDFWKTRNEVMADYIIQYIEITKAKKVVVFTGLLHKYYLLDLLATHQGKDQYEIIEYFSP